MVEMDQIGGVLLDIYELAEALTEEERAATQAVAVAYTITDQDYRWSMTFNVEEVFYKVDFLHRADEVKDVRCHYCQTDDCLHIKAAYIEIVKELQRPVFYSIEEDLRQYSYDELVRMLATISYKPGNLLQPYLQPAHYSLETVYAMIDESLNRVSGHIDEQNENEAFAGINDITANAVWLHKKEPYLAVRHLLACLESTYKVAARCDRDVHHIMSVSLDAQLSSFLEKLTDSVLAKAVTKDIVNTIHTCAAYPHQPVPMDCFIYSAIHLSRVSKMGQEIREVITQYKGTFIKESHYERYLSAIHL